MLKKLMSFASVAVMLASVGTQLASAHHSHAAYEPVKMVKITGVVSEVQWTNPHMWIVLDVPDGKGGTAKWGFEAAGTATSVAAALSPEVLKVGNTITVVAHPNRNSTKHEALFMGLVDVNGQVVPRGGRYNVRAEAAEGKKK